MATAIQSSKRTVRYFISYAHADGSRPDQLLAELRKQFDGCAGYKYVAWSDLTLLPGEKWHGEIKSALSACDFGLLLVSPSFFGSRYIKEHELPTFINGEKPCVPVALCRIDFDNQDLKGLADVQVFRLKGARGRSKTFGECTSADQREKFVHELYLQIRARLDKLFVGQLPAAAPVASSLAAFNLPAYRQHIADHFLAVDLARIRAADIAQFVPLTNIFIEQNARAFDRWLPQLAALTETERERLAERADIDHEHSNDAREKYFAQPTLPIGQILDEPEHRCVVLVGDPGAGKSALIRYRLACWRESPTATTLPVLIELRHYNTCRKDGNLLHPLDYLEHRTGFGWCFPRSEFEEVARKPGVVTVFFDGLDEVFARPDRSAVSRAIADLANEFENLRIVVTTRPIGYKSDAFRQNFRQFLLEELTIDQIRDFLGRWHRETYLARDQDRAARRRDSLIATLTKPATPIRVLAGNPLLLTLIAILNRDHDIPRERSLLYEECAVLLVDTWEVVNEREIGPGLTADQLKTVAAELAGYGRERKMTLLRQLAGHMVRGARSPAATLLSRSELETHLSESLRTVQPPPTHLHLCVEAMIRQLIQRNFILCFAGADNFAFVHRTFLEYFAARQTEYLKYRGGGYDLPALYRAHGAQPEWAETLSLLAGFLELSDASDVIGVLLTLWDGTNHPAPILLAARCVSESQRKGDLGALSERVRAKCLDVLATRVSTDKNVDAELIDLRVNVTTLLADVWSGRSDSVALLKDLVNGKCQGADVWFRPRVQAGHCLIEHSPGNDSARDWLELTAREADDAITQGVCCCILAEHFTDERTRSLLIEKAHSRQEAATYGIMFLAEYFTDDATRALLLKIVRGGDDTEIRGSALHWLGRHFDDGKTRALLEGLARNTHDAKFLGKIVWTLALYFRTSPRTRKALCKLAKTPAGRAIIEECARDIYDEGTKEYLHSVLSETVDKKQEKN
jgi:hypothetical protein